ncbi:MAG: GerMN domain-containing protein [bacterium]|nr:GerMN domain-containing protein [bacterium]
MARKKNKTFLIMVTMVISAIIISFIYLYIRDKGLFVTRKKIVPYFFEGEKKYIEIKLYFSSPDASCLMMEKREVKKCKNTNEQIKLIIEELIKGPQTKLEPTLPSECKTKEIFLHKETIFVNFDQSIITKHCKGSSGEILTTYSIVNTLLDNLNKYKKVQILVEGREVETLAGHIFFKKPFYKNMKLVKKVTNDALLPKEDNLE